MLVSSIAFRLLFDAINKPQQKQQTHQQQQWQIQQRSASIKVKEMARRSKERAVNSGERQRGVVGCEQSAYELKWHLCVCCEYYRHVIQLLLHATKNCCCCIYGMLCIVIIATTTAVATAICGCLFASSVVVALSLFVVCLLSADCPHIVRSLIAAHIHSYVWFMAVACLHSLLLLKNFASRCCCNVVIVYLRIALLLSRFIADCAHCQFALFLCVLCKVTKL